MAFPKLKCVTAYATGAIRSNLDKPHLIAKLKRAGLRAELTGGQLRIQCGEEIWQCGEEIWEFGGWLADGVGRIGWARMRIMGDAGSLSRRLAQAGIRDKFEYSRSRAISKPTPCAP